VNKLRYHIYMPSRYYAFGTTIPVDFTLFPLAKGIKIGKVKMELLERVGLELSTPGENDISATTLGDKIVTTVEQKRPQEISQQMVEQTTGQADESLHFRVELPLKKSLNDCRQTVHTDRIKIYHNLKIYVNIHNPDGHISQLCLRHLVHIYISPHTQIRDDQSIATPVTAAQTQTISIGDAFDSAPPPQYGTHILDQLYEDIDTSGFVSGVTTPNHFLSRHPSTENMSAQFAATDPGEQSDHDSHRSSGFITDIAAVHLQTRLQVLQDRRPSIASISSGLPTPPIITAEFVPPNPAATLAGEPMITLEPPTPVSPLNATASSLLSRRGRSSSLRGSLFLSPSAALEIPSPQRTAPASQISFDLDALNRTPSYDAAIRAPLPEPPSPSSEGLPSYDIACGLTTAPSSPGFGSRHDSLTGSLQVPLTPPLDADQDMPLHGLYPPSPAALAVPMHLATTPPLQQGELPPQTRFGGFLHPDLANNVGRLNRPPRAHHRGHTRSSSVNVEGEAERRVKMELEARQQAAERERRRPSLAIGMGGANLLGLWNGLRRGSVA
jgi:hypothetical protein